MDPDFLSEHWREFAFAGCPLASVVLLRSRPFVGAGALGIAGLVAGIFLWASLPHVTTEVVGWRTVTRVLWAVATLAGPWLLIASRDLDGQFVGFGATLLATSALFMALGHTELGGLTAVLGGAGLWDAARRVSDRGSWARDLESFTALALAGLVGALLLGLLLSRSHRASVFFESEPWSLVRDRPAVIVLVLATPIAGFALARRHSEKRETKR